MLCATGNVAIAINSKPRVSYIINPRHACAARVTVLGLCVCVCVCLWEEEKKERVLGIEMAFVRGHLHRCLNTCACLA